MKIMELCFLNFCGNPDFSTEVAGDNSKVAQSSSN